MEFEKIHNKGQAQLFKSQYLEYLTKTHPLVIWGMYLPVMVLLPYYAFNSVNFSGLSVFLLFIAGMFFWSFTEYILHRFVFHYHPTSEFGKKIHFIFHGVHHDYPRDKKRLVMPPSASIPLATLFYFLFSLFLEKQFLFSFFPGFLLGYLVYDMMHYAMHHHNFKHPVLKKIKQHHMLHHYQDASKGYGVSSSLWDVILKSDFEKQPTKN